jgi:putative ABC transport system permease protein
MGSIIRDLRRAVRGLLREPGFTVAALLTLGLGIGAATAIFSMVDAVLLRPLPFAGQDRLMVVWGEMRARNLPKVEVSIQDWQDWRTLNHVFADLAVITTTDSDMAETGGAEPNHVRGRLVSANFFSLLGARPALGRTFAPAEERPAAPRVAVLGYGFWRRRFGGDPKVIGRQVKLDGDSHTVIGVMPAAFRFPADADVFTTLAPLYADPESRTLRIFKAIGRLRPGVGLDTARRDMTALSGRLQRERPRADDGYGALVVPLADEILGDSRRALLLLLGAVGLLLLIACVNVAGLLLARATSRQKEAALRTALGAGRMRLVAQLLAESLALSGAAAVVGLLLAWLGVRVLSALGGTDVPRLDEIALDGRALAFAIGVAAGTALLFGLAPALHTASPDLAVALKEGGKASAGVRSGRLRATLVVFEVALALVVLVGAGLLVRSFVNLERTDLGFRPQGVLAFRATLNGSKYPEPRRWAAFYTAAVRRLGALPGVRQAAAVLMRPLSGPIGWEYYYAIEGQSRDEARANPIANHERVSPGYFAAMGIRLLAGRDFAWSDTDRAPAVVIVNASTARRAWPGQSAIGKRLRWLEPGKHPWLQVVGVVDDVRYRDVQTVRPDVYVPYLQEPHWAMDLIVESATDPLALAPAARREIAEIDREQPISGLTTMEQAVSDSLAGPRLRTLLLSAFAALALLLAAVGLYGIIAYTVARRRQEIGIRLALGAGRGAIARLVLRQGLALTAAGLAAGIAAVIAGLAGGTGWIDSLLYGVSATDLTTFAVVPLLLVAVALLASLLPARRATRVDPLVALRAE